MAGGVCECRFLLSEVVRSVVVSICGRACRFLGLNFLLRRSLCGRPSRHWSAVDRNTKSTLSSLNNERGHCHSYQMELVCWTALIRITLPLEIILACTPSWSLQLLIMQCSQQCIVSVYKYAAGSSWDLVE